MATPVTVYVIGYNEVENLRELLPTIRWADEIIYVDSFSTDGTANFCAENGVRHFDVKFEGFGKLRNRALELASHDWVVSIDTDERATPEFAAEVRQTLVQPEHAAYFVPRCNTFIGRPVRHGGMYPDYRQPQVFDRRKLRYREHLVHEGFECSGTTGYFKSFIWQHPWPTLGVAARKTDRYATLMAERRFADGQTTNWLEILLAPQFGFIKKYFVQAGFRDGMPGLILAGLHSYYTFLKYVNLWELQQRGKSGGPSKPA